MSEGEGREIVAEDFDAIVAERDEPPKPTPAAIDANRLHRALVALNRRDGGGE